MPDLDERVAVLEGRVQEQAVHMADLRGVGAEVRQEIRVLRDEMNRRFEHVEQRFEHVEGRFERARRSKRNLYRTVSGARKSATDLDGRRHYPTLVA